MKDRLKNLVIRPVTLKDLEAVEGLAFSAQTGMTFLPKNKELLKEKIINNQEALNKRIDRPNGEIYFFVLEDSEKKTIVGCCGVISRIGCKEPFYTYQIKKMVKVSKMLGKSNQVSYLNLKKIHQGPAELCGLYLKPEYRDKGIGRLLSLSRFMFVHMHPNRFERKVIAEMRGISDENGVSPFWEAVGRHFFNMDFATADMLSSHTKVFVDELMPTIPICTNILPLQAQQCMGKAHQNTWPALKLLEQEGFEMTDFIDIFDGGPKMMSSFNKVRVIKETNQTQHVKISESDVKTKEISLVATGKLSDFRVAIMNVKTNPKEEKSSQSEENTVTISKKEANLIKYKKESPLYFSPLYPKNRESKILEQQKEAPILHYHKDMVKEKVMAISNGQKHQYQSFLRRFSEWYKSVVITSEVDG